MKSERGDVSAMTVLHNPSHLGDSKVGSPELDPEHQVQMELANALVVALQRGHENRAIGEILDQLATYSNAHFMAEQLLMRLHAYPQYAAHLQEHDRYMERLQEVQQRYQAGDVALTRQAAESLRAWLHSHIHGADRALGDYLSAQARGGA
jgi:hemerythrin